MADATEDNVPAVDHESPVKQAQLAIAQNAKSTKAASQRAKKFNARSWLRAIHRDAGYLVVGLTFIYALSGLAVNHITDWADGDPSFHSYSETHQLGALKGSDDEVAKLVREKLHIKTEPREVYRRDEDDLDVTFDHRSLHINTKTGEVLDEGQKPRFFLRVANWLHLNRGKRAWTYVADGFAVILLFLSLSGIFMIAGKRGFFYRGMIFIAIGIAVPALYVAYASP